MRKESDGKVFKGEMITRLFPDNNESLNEETYAIHDKGTQFSVIAVKLVIRQD
jgi:hypothetical protein